MNSSRHLLNKHRVPTSTGFYISKSKKSYLSIW